MALNVLAGHGIMPAEAGSACAGAAELGLISNLDGSAALSREEAAVITSRLLNLVGLLPEADAAILDVYADTLGISSWALDAVAQMTACGLMSGSNGCFDPQGTLTNEQAAALMVRAEESPASSATYGSAAAAEAPATGSAAQDIVALGAEDMMLSRAGKMAD